MQTEYLEIYPSKFNEKFLNLKHELFGLIKEITTFLDIPVAVRAGSVIGSVEKLALKCDPFQSSLFKDFFRDRARYITADPQSRIPDEEIESLFTPPTIFKLPQQPV